MNKAGVRPQDRPEPRRLIRPGFLILINVIYVVYAYSVSQDILNYRTATSGSFTVAEAAYVNSLWTRQLVDVCILIAANIALVGYMICQRLNGLHRAVQFAADTHEQRRAA